MKRVMLIVSLVFLLIGGAIGAAGAYRISKNQPLPASPPAGGLAGIVDQMDKELLNRQREREREAAMQLVIPGAVLAGGGALCLLLAFAVRRAASKAEIA